MALFLSDFWISWLILWGNVTAEPGYWGPRSRVAVTIVAERSSPDGGLRVGCPEGVGERYATGLMERVDRGSA